MQEKMRKCLWALIVASVLSVGLGTAWADPVSIDDEFDRGPADDLGSNWINPTAFSINASNVAVGTNPGIHISLYSGAEVAGNDFTVIAYGLTCTSTSTATIDGNIGVVFNYQDENNYYWVQMETANYARLWKKVDGSDSLWGDGFAQVVPSASNLTINYYKDTNNYRFRFGNDSYIFWATDDSFAGQGGGVGLFSSAGASTTSSTSRFRTTYDSVPEPASIALLMVGSLALIRKRTHR